MDTVPRRIRLDLLTPAERVILEAIEVIEHQMGNDERLTIAQRKLQEAKDLVADYVDEELSKVTHTIS